MFCFFPQKPWFWDTRHCWYNFPRQHVAPEIYWYYMCSLGFYWSLIFSLLIDNKRKVSCDLAVTQSPGHISRVDKNNESYLLLNIEVVSSKWPDVIIYHLFLL